MYEKWLKKKEELFAIHNLILEKAKNLNLPNKEDFIKRIKEGAQKNLSSEGKEFSEQQIEEEANRLSSQIDALCEAFFYKKNEPLLPIEVFFSGNQELSTLHLFKLDLVKLMYEMGEFYMLIEKFNQCARELNNIINIGDKFKKMIPQSVS